MRQSFIFLLALLVLIPLTSFGAGVPARYGSPLYNTYEPEDYHGEGQNFDLTVNSRNIIYVANAAGVLEFDGTRWRTIEGTTSSIPFGVEADSQDNIWVSMQRDLGVIMPDSTGRLSFHSLLPFIGESLEISSGIWRVRTTPFGIFFQSPQFLLRWKHANDNLLEGEATIWPANGHSYTLSCLIDSTFYVRQHSSPIKQLEGDSLVVVPEWADVNRKSFVHATKFDDVHVLFTTFSGELFVGGPEGIRELRLDLPEGLSFPVTFGSVPIDDDKFVLSSSRGICVFNKKGHITEVIDNLGGLSTRNVLRESTVDLSGGYWFPMDYGLARIEFERPMRILDRGNGIEGAVFKILRFNDKLHIATGTGLYVHPERDSLSVPRLTTIENVELAVHQMEKTNDRLYLATVRGLYYLDKNERLSFVPPFNGNAVGLAITSDEKNLYLGSELQGLYHYRVENGEITSTGRLDLTQIGFDRLAMDPQENLWALIAEPEGKALHRAPIDLNNPTKIDFEHYDEEKGITGMVIGTPFVLEDSLRAITEDGFFTFDPGADRFIPSLVPFPINLNNTFLMEAPLVDDQERIYLSTDPYSTVRVSLDPSAKNPVEQLLQRSPILRVLAFYYDPVSQMTVFGTDDGRLVFTGDQVTPQTPVTLLREAIIGDRVLPLHSTLEEAKNPSIFQGPLKSVRFVYTVTSYDAPEMSEFQYRLLGRGDEWSAWSDETYRDFNDLREGAYRFEVRGRDYSRQVSEPAMYSFTVLPPWYRTTWMMVIWSLLTVGLVYLIIQVRTRQLAGQQLRLEGLVRKRTEELKQAQEAEIREIEARKAAELESNRLKTVAQLATTIAHELNNPLAVIQGRIEVADMHRELDPELRIVHESIRDQVSRMSKLVDKLTGIESIRVVDYAGGIKMLDLKPPQKLGSQGTSSGPGSQQDDSTEEASD